jgi:hypothetical protein
MALQLGGPNVAKYIVPPYQHWQQSGAWRVMEVLAEKTTLPQAIFVALLEYGNLGDAIASNLRPTFGNGDIQVYWGDFRVPTRFHVWILEARIEDFFGNPGWRPEGGRSSECSAKSADASPSSTDLCRLPGRCDAAGRSHLWGKRRAG